MATPTQQTSVVATQQTAVAQPNSLDRMRNAKKQLLSGGSRSSILHLNDGDSIRLHILREMTQGIVFSMHRMEGVAPYKAVCAFEIGQQCEYCRRARAGEWKMKATDFMYLPVALVVEGENGGKPTIGVRLLELYASKKRNTYDTLDDFYRDNHTVCSHDFVFSRQGTKKEETTYGFSVQISASIFKQDTLTRLAASATTESIRQRVLDAFPCAIVGSGEGDTDSVESEIVVLGEADDIPNF